MQTMNPRDLRHMEQVYDQIKQTAVTVTMSASDLVVHAANTAAAIVITLPTVAEAAGKIYTIYTTDATGATGVDVISQGDELYSVTESSTSIDVSSAVAIDTAGDFLCMYCNGVSWICLAFNIQ